jgi:hypothetical protein
MLSSVLCRLAIFYLSEDIKCIVGCGRTGQKEEEGSLFYGLYKQAYIHERHERTRKCMMSKE